MNQPAHRFARFAAAVLLLVGAAFAADPTEGPSMPEHLKAQSAAERKLDTPLRVQLQARGLDRAQGGTVAEGHPDDDPVTVQITGTLSPALTDAITAAHGTVTDQSPRWGVLRATLPLASVLVIAARPDVTRVRLPARARTN